MTINHLYLLVSHAKMPAMTAFYKNVLAPLGYTQMITVSERHIGFGSDYPYLWLKSLPEGKESNPTHVAIGIHPFPMLSLHIFRKARGC